MTISQLELDALVTDCERGANAWVNGQLEEAVVSVFTQDDAMVLAGPFGGMPRKGRAEWGVVQPKVVAQFSGGHSKNEVIDVMSSGDLAVLVLIERGSTQFPGQSSPQTWTLRTTQVFRKIGPNRWTRLHRHADPLIDRRPLEQTAALARGE
jgi:ketosteroid isomerase-like protein